jgi:thioredoxin reductase/Pyruvate/2-oxoacid:ferredoxin oxidoreductase delta subunit
VTWSLLIGLVLALGLALAALLARRAELARMHELVQARSRAVRMGSAKAQLQHPVIDLSRCLGCGTCVAACPEEGVLELVHGQAVVVNGARCVGHAACARECPVGAITVTLTDLLERRDVPVLSPQLEAVGTPGLFLAGEVTAHGLIKTAIAHGTAVAAEVARRVERQPAPKDEVLDLCIVGAGPAGLACSLEAKRRGLAFATLDQAASLGGTVAQYPRRKVVVTEPLELPIFGTLEGSSDRTTFTKEELVDLWQTIAREAELPIHSAQVFQGLERDERGRFIVETQAQRFTARHVCLALGRRGSPRKLGVPGEELPKVAYSLLDARSYQGRRILVVGGGDSAVEAAMGLAEQPGNLVTLSYRGEALTRIRSRNARRLEESIAERKLSILLSSRLVAVHAEFAELEVAGEPLALANDEVFVMVGGTQPVALLESAGVSFDPALREPLAPLAEQGSGLTRALCAGFVLALAALVFALYHADYYLLAPEDRALHAKHAELRPSSGTGLWMGVGSLVLIGVNLLYLVRRSPRWRLKLGSLCTWMTCHVATGILALLAAMLHASMAPRDTVGGHAFWALVVLALSGAIGRYFYARVPRAANGRELELEEIQLRLGRLRDAIDPRHRRFVEHVHATIGELVHARQWRTSFLGLAFALLSLERERARTVAGLAREGRAQGIPEPELREILQLARRAHHTALAAAHLEDLRAVLNTWRFVHRWFAALLLALLAVHVAHALIYGEQLRGGESP